MSDYKFEPFQRVLGRMCVEDNWKIDFYVNYDSYSSCPHRCFRFNFAECIPYEGNEHLLGTSNDPAPKWQPKEGELVAVANDKRFWYPKFFLREEAGQFAVKSCPEHTNYDRYVYCEPFHDHFNVPEK